MMASNWQGILNDSDTQAQRMARRIRKKANDVLVQWRYGGSEQTRKLGWVRCTFPLRGRMHVKVPLPLKPTLCSLKIFLREERTASRCLFLADMLAGVCVLGSDFVELLARMGGTWAVAPGIPCYC